MNCHLMKNQSESVVYNNIKLLRDDNQLFDISLICEDGVILSAHKLILAAHSDKFKKNKEIEQVICLDKA